MKKYLLAMMIFMSFYSATGLAQLGAPVQSDAKANVSGPGLEETQKWIKEELEGHKGGKSYGRDVMHKIYFEQCDVIYIKDEKQSWGWYYEKTSKFPLAHITIEVVDSRTFDDGVYYSPHIDLRGLNQKEVFISPTSILEPLNTLPSDRLEKELYRLKNNPAHSSAIGPSIYVSSTVLAERFAKAFDHARKLCQNIELEKSAEHMKNDYKRNSKKPGDLF